MKTIFTFLSVIAISVNVTGQTTLNLHPTINSIGFEVNFPASFDADSDAYCFVKYKKADSSAIDGFPASRINKFGQDQFRGSLFMLEANTEYIVSVTLVDSFPTLQTFLLTDSVFTKAEPIVAATSTLKYVSPTGSGTLYSDANPGNLKTLLDSGLACGTTVLLKGGTYSTGNMQLNLTQDCTSSTPIVIMAAPGEKPILDGGDYTQYTWTQDASDPDLYSATINPGLEYNSLCLMDSTRLYPYAFKTPWVVNPVYPCLTELDYGLSGFYRNNTKVVYIKTLDHKDPNNSMIVFSRYFSSLEINGNNHQNYLFLKGISFKNYGKGICDTNFLGDPVTCYSSYTLSFENANRIVIDSCSFEFCNAPITFRLRCNENIIQNNIFRDGIGEWSHAAFKQTRDAINPLRDLFFNPIPNFESETVGGSMGRYLEYAAINLRPDSLVIQDIQKGNIIRNNKVKGTVGGLVGEFFAATGKNRAIEETDIYNNKVSYCYNGINADGGSINTRIWGNEVDHCSVSLSFIMGWVGPNYVLRNNIHHIIERKNLIPDPHFLDCDNTKVAKSWGTGIKMNANPLRAIPPEMFLINNTFHAQDSIAFDLYLWERTWKKFHSYNNIYYSEGRSSLIFDGIKDSSDYTFESKNDCYFSKNSALAATIRPVHGNTLCIDYATGSALGTGLNAVSQSPDVSVSGDFNLNPDFVNVSSDYHLQQSSALIDQGIVVQGINQKFIGLGPDVGAFESEYTTSITELKSTHSFLLYPNPAGSKVILSAYFSSEKDFYLLNALGQVLMKGQLAEKQTEINLESYARGVYFVRIGTQLAKLVHN